jgi:SAM-dependent methyltransferase
VKEDVTIMGLDEASPPVKANRLAWNERAAINLRDATGYYAIDRFRAGEDLLMEIESHEIGDVAGKRVAHLQCHLGLEALCLARRGAVVTGLDFSETAIEGARALAAEMGLAATFVWGNVYDARAMMEGQFDIVFVSWGSLNWLPDIWSWGEIIAALLAPGGYLYLIDQHPFLAMMKEIDNEPRPFFAWRTLPETPIVTDMPTSYNNDPTPLVHARLHEWDHPLSDIIGALTDAGLRLDFFREHELIPWRRLSTMVPVTDRLFRLPASAVPMPLSFSLKASKS